MHNGNRRSTSYSNLLVSFLCSRNQGFTLLELIIVIIIIGIASALVGIMIGAGSSRLEFRALAKEMSATLRYARNHAVSEKKTYCFVINTDEGKYRLYNDRSEGGEDDKNEPVITRQLPDDVNITMNEEESELYEIEFFPQGNSSGGVIELQRKSGETLYIRINRLSGKVEVMSSLD